MVAVHLTWQNILRAILCTIPVDKLVLSFIEMHIGFLKYSSPLEWCAVEDLATFTMAVFRVERLFPGNLKLHFFAETGACVDSVERLAGIGEGVGGTIHSVTVDLLLLLLGEISSIFIVFREGHVGFLL